MRNIFAAFMALLLPTAAALAQSSGNQTNIRPVLSSTGTIQTTGAAPTVTASAYAANSVVSGPFQFPASLIVGPSGAIDPAYADPATITITTVGVQPTFELLIFGKPLVGTYTDQNPFNLNGSDVPIARLLSDSYWSNNGTSGMFDILAPEPNTTQTVFSTAGTTTLYGLLIVRSTWTPATTADLSSVVLHTEPK